MQMKRNVIDSTFSCAVDFELSNERDSIKVAPNSSICNNSTVTHVKPAESCLKYSITWKNISIPFAKGCDRFGQLKIIPNQRVAVIGKVEKNSKGEYQIGAIPRKRSLLPGFNLDMLQGLLLVVRETAQDCRQRLYGSGSDTLPNYTLIETLHMPPGYEGRDEEADVDLGVANATKNFKLPFSAQSSLVRKLAPFHENPGWAQEIMFMILVILVVVLAVLPLLLGNRLSFFWYWPLLVIRINIGHHGYDLDKNNI
eukprot:NODE_321_length_9805_cov_0.700185.p7 type:complete len:255 gc:universal NODE_321_length_9805_cov_0.700185:8719-7955(-)